MARSGSPEALSTAAAAARTLTDTASRPSISGKLIVVASEPKAAVFLSYASQDAEAARRIGDAFAASGIEVWFDQSELRGGDAWDQKIRAQIRDCALFVPLISSNTASRLEGYFRLEWKFAVDRTHLMAVEKTFLLPVVIDFIEETKAFVPDKFREVQWTRAPNGEVPPGFVERVARLMSADTTEGPTSTSALYALGRRAEADAALASAEKTVGAGAAYQIAIVYAGRRTLLAPLIGSSQHTNSRCRRALDQGRPHAGFYPERTPVSGAAGQNALQLMIYTRD